MNNENSHKNFYWLTCVIVAALGVFGLYELFKARAYKQSLEDTYNRAFFELTDYVDDIETLLAKSALITSPTEMATLSQELSVQASAAKSCLAQLPITEVQLDKTSKFLSQVGDYTYSLSQNLINKKTIQDSEYDNLSSLGAYASSLNQSLAGVAENVYNGSLHFGENASVSLQKVAYAEEEDPFSSIEKEFGEYPALIYDGPFSEHIEGIKPKMTENCRELTVQEAAGKVEKFFNAGSDKVTYQGESQNSNLNSYVFKCISGKSENTVSVTKCGGFITYFINNRRVRSEKLSVDDAISHAQKFLESKGYENMQNSYYEKTAGVATVNFAYKQNNVICYSDLIKVKVALDTGEIVGMEANGYVMNHSIRDIRKPVLTKQEARDKVSKKLSIDTVNIALIPKDSKREVLCYEFKGTSNDKNFLIYINAETGNEEDIQLLIESPDGILTI